MQQLNDTVIKHITELNTKANQLNVERQKLIGASEQAQRQYDECVQAYCKKYGVTLTADNLLEEYEKVKTGVENAAKELERQIDYIEKGEYKTVTPTTPVTVTGTDGAQVTAAVSAPEYVPTSVPVINQDNNGVATQATAGSQPVVQGFGQPAPAQQFAAAPVVQPTQAEPVVQPKQAEPVIQPQGFGQPVQAEPVVQPQGFGQPAPAPVGGRPLINPTPSATEQVSLGVNGFPASEVTVNNSGFNGSAVVGGVGGVQQGFAGQPVQGGGVPQNAVQGAGIAPPQGFEKMPQSAQEANAQLGSLMGGKLNI